MITCDAIGNLAAEAWLARTGNPQARLTAEHIEAARRNRVDVSDRLSPAVEVKILDNKRLATFRNALSAGKGTSGEFTIPESAFVAPWEQALFAMPMRDLATTIRIDKGDVFREPMTDDTANEGRMLGESQTSTATDPTFQQIMHRPYKFHSDRVAVPSELAQDATNFPPQLAALLGARVARLQNRKFTLGSGASEPTGIVTAANAAGATVTAANAASIVADDLLNLIGGIGSGYLSRNCVFQMARSTLLACMKLKDGQGAYLFDRPSFTIAGFGVRLNHHLSAIGSGNTSVVFGDHSKYHIVDFAGVRLMRDGESRADLDEVAWAAIMRSTGNLLDAGQHPIAILTH